MKKLILLSIFCISNLFLFAQQDSIFIKKKSSAREQNYIVFNFFTDIWHEQPENISIRNFSPGIYIAPMYRTNLSKEFSIGIGLGISSHNTYTNSTLSTDKDGISVFTRIPDNVNYKKYKLSTTYLCLPLELNFIHKNFRAIVGAKGGYLISSKTKYKGDDFFNNSTESIKIKTKGIDNLQAFTYGPYIRIGVKNMIFSAYYRMNDLFETNKGPVMNSISIGVALSN